MVMNALQRNCRPIAIVPALCKVLSGSNRMLPILEEGQCPDQAGFRSGFRTENDVHVLYKRRLANFICHCGARRVTSRRLST
eukprot:188520-Pyramimonas_sp.AAC.1